MTKDSGRPRRWTMHENRRKFYMIVPLTTILSTITMYIDSFGINYDTHHVL